MRIRPTGNVGIGTSNPSSLLHLASNAPYITFEDEDNNQDWQLQATSWFALRNQSSNSELLRITSSGDVGIGTTSPAYPLEVNRNDTGTVVSSFESAASAAYVSLVSSTTTANNVRFGAIGNHAVIQAGGSEVVRIRSNGNVGIKFSSPGDTLTVSGNIGVTGTVDGRDIAADGSKLDGIETTTGDQTAAEILAAIKTVDGSGSGSMLTCLTAHKLIQIQLETLLSSVQVIRTSIADWSGKHMQPEHY